MNVPYNQDFFSKIADVFDKHVEDSIPEFKAVQRNIARNIARHRKATVLDVCGSTGELGRELLKYGFKGEYTCLDGSREMQDVFSSNPYSDHLRFVRAGFMSSWSDTPLFESKKYYDYAVESLGFQFFTRSRVKEVREMKRLAKTCVFYEKFSTDHDTFVENEMLKDEYKLKSFTIEELAKKRSEVLDIMHDYLYDADEFLSLLNAEFKYVYVIAHVGNFKAFLCTDDRASAHAWNIYLPLLINKFTADSPIVHKKKLPELNLDLPLAVRYLTSQELFPPRSNYPAY